MDDKIYYSHFDDTQKQNHDRRISVSTITPVSRILMLAALALSALSCYFTLPLLLYGGLGQHMIAAIVAAIFIFIGWTYIVGADVIRGFDRFLFHVSQLAAILAIPLYAYIICSALDAFMKWGDPSSSGFSPIFACEVSILIGLFILLVIFGTLLSARIRLSYRPGDMTRRYRRSGHKIQGWDGETYYVPYKVSTFWDFFDAVDAYEPYSAGHWAYLKYCVEHSFGATPSQYRRIVGRLEDAVLHDKTDGHRREAIELLVAALPLLSKANNEKDSALNQKVDTNILWIWSEATDILTAAQIAAADQERINYGRRIRQRNADTYRRLYESEERARQARVNASGGDDGGRAEPKPTLPTVIYDDSNRQWTCVRRTPDFAAYQNSDGDQVDLYATDISGSGANTSMGYFHWY